MAHNPHFRFMLRHRQNRPEMAPHGPFAMEVVAYVQGREIASCAKFGPFSDRYPSSTSRHPRFGPLYLVHDV